MIRKLLLTLAALAALAACSNHGRGITAQQLEQGFAATPDSIKTSVYWYWISNHISEQGVVKDLESMKQIGIDRAFIGNIGLDDAESGEGKVKFYSEEWWRVMHAALKRASELGIEIGIFNCPGWSQSGGPWVKPSQAMRYLASVSVALNGGRHVDMTLPRPAQTTDYYEDVRLMAYPAPQGQTLRIEGGSGRTSVEFSAAEPFTARSLRLYMDQRPVDCPAVLEAAGDDGIFRTLAEFPVTRFNPALHVGFDPYAPIVISIPATTAARFRLVLKNPTPGCGIREAQLSSLPVVERYPEKTLAKMYQTPLPYWHEYMWREQPATDDPSLTVDPAKVIDISDKLSGDRLAWDAPAGEWIVLRTGMLPTGVTNSPARPEARGLETDKMSREHVEAHFEAFLGEIHRRIPAKDRTCWKVVVEDSYETGGQNFTDGFLEQFRERYGYDPAPFLPVYSGVVVGSEEISDRFLWDMRRMVADKVAYDYVGGLREVSHKYGLTTWLENYGHWGFPGEFLQYGGQSDEIGGEFWSEGSLGDIENRAASSCGHIYGKTKISAESFTAGGGGFHRYPAMMKQRGDRFFTEGINNTLLHLYISQPYEDREPGVNATFGNEFNRKNTWFPHLDLFIGYLKRVNFMLQQGLNVADAAYFIGEDTPKMTGVTDPALPKGYQFDYINAEVIEKRLTVRDGLLTLPHGTQYRILVLPKLETMRPELLRRIAGLIEEGAVVLGSAPRRSPSYQNYPAADKEVNKLADELWSQVDSTTRYARIGRGMLIEGLDMEQALRLIGCAPDCRTEAADPILYNHRSVNGMEIYFVSNQSADPVEVSPVFRVKGLQPEAWNAIDGTMRLLPAYTQTTTGTQVPLRLEGYESVFVVFRNPSQDTPASCELAANYPGYRDVQEMNGTWTITFDAAKRGPAEPIVTDKLFDLAQSADFNIRHYSGRVAYTTVFKLDSVPRGELWLDLGRVAATAKVSVNGMPVGGVWTPPYRIDITRAVTRGENSVEIEVLTTWKNRLVGDLNLPEKERRTWVAYQPWTAAEPLQESGLLGSVHLQNVN